MSANQLFNPSNYCIVYEEVMDNKEARKLFHEFLNQSRNDEPLLFLDSVSEYRKVYEQVLKDVFGGWSDDKTCLKNSSVSSKQSKLMFKNDVIGRVETIMDTYIEVNSERELNIGTTQSTMLKNWQMINNDLIEPFVFMSDGHNSNTRLSFCSVSDSYLTLEEFESSIMSRLNPDTLFSNVITIVHLDLKMDQFPRFVRSEKLFNLLKLKGESFTRSIGYDISKGYKVDLRFKPKDLKEQVITNDHIYFGFTLAEDTPDWKMIHGRKDLCCYSSNSTYFFGGSKGMKLLKAVMYLPFSLEDVMVTLYNSDNHDSFDRQTKGFVLQDYRQPSRLGGEIDGQSSYATQCLSISIDLSLPIIKKRILTSVATTISETDLFFHVLHTADFTEQAMPTNQRVKGDSLTYYLFQPN